jgi:hypothetical protein
VALHQYETLSRDGKEEVMNTSLKIEKKYTSPGFVVEWQIDDFSATTQSPPRKVLLAAAQTAAESTRRVTGHPERHMEKEEPCDNYGAIKLLTPGSTSSPLSPEGP